MSDIIGRDPELAIADQLFQREEPELRSLLIRGEAGIGKSMFWTEVMDRAASSGHLVLRCRSVEAEAPLPYVTLGDLLASVDRRHRHRLPPPQRRALEIALLETDAEEYPLQSRAVGAGMVTMLREASAEASITIGIDDAQWIDRSSEAVLSFALRRLTDVPITLVVSSRSDSGVPALTAHLEEVTVLALEPLDVAGMFHLLRNRVGRVYARPTLVRIWETSAGNPLYALEAARALEESGVRPEPGEPLPLPSHRADLISRRLVGLSGAAREALLAVALLPSPTVAQVVAALGEKARSSLEQAVSAGIVSIEGDEVRFGHQLYASVLVGDAGDHAKKEMHLKLADTCHDLDAKVRHLALGAHRPDESLASQLEEAAVRAERRGAPEIAADLYELAERLTPEDQEDARASRLIGMAELILRSGDAERAWNEVDRVLMGSPSPRSKARALDLKARISYVAATPAEAVRACDQALSEPDLPMEVKARLLAIRAIVEYDDLEQAHQDAVAALELIATFPHPHPAVHCLAILAFAESELARGQPLPFHLIEEGLKLELLEPNPTVSDRLSASLGAWLKYTGDFKGSRHWLEHTYRAAVEEGDEGSLPYAVSHLPQLELWSGNWEAAERWALEHLSLADRTGQKNQRLDALFNLAQVWAHQGRVEEATAAAHQGLDESGRDAFSVMVFESVLGFLDLSMQDAGSAIEHLSTSSQSQEDIGAHRPSWRMAHHAEALIGSGDLVGARLAVDTFEGRARAAGMPMHIANALRCRAMLQAADQDLVGAQSTIVEALGHHAEMTIPFDLARTLLVQGKLLRRRGERRAALHSIETAKAMFADLGASLWKEQAEEEMKRVPIKRRHASSSLTDGEMRVARLVAQGLSNREIAAELFISPKTVEANLSRIYTKLGLRSRAALAAWMTATAAETSEK